MSSKPQSAAKLQPVRGTHDLLPAEMRAHRNLVNIARMVAEFYNFAEVQTPVFEFSDVFHRTLGDTSDVVTKETYTFDDRGGESLTLRPEFTAAIVRMLISESLTQDLPQKFFYYGPAFRYERPQKGRLRQFHQIGVEMLGAAEPEADAEVIALGNHILNVLDVGQHTKLEMNTLGDAESRNAYRSALVEYFSKYKNDLSPDSQARLEKNPLRILDSKSEGDRKLIDGVPQPGKFLTASAQAFFDRVQAMLGWLNVPFMINSRLVRGLDYYQHTVFEFTTESLGAQGTVLAGGRYDGLVKLMGGPDVAGIGFAAGVERLLGLQEAAGGGVVQPQPVIAVVPVGESCEQKAWQLAQSLRHKGFSVDMSYKGNVGKQMKRANKVGAVFALLIGDEELASNTVMVKDLRTGTQEAVAMDAVSEKLGPSLRLQG